MRPQGEGWASLVGQGSEAEGLRQLERRALPYHGLPRMCCLQQGRSTCEGRGNVIVVFNASLDQLVHVDRHQGKGDCYTKARASVVCARSTGQAGGAVRYTASPSISAS